jgi:hypothetical protein
MFLDAGSVIPDPIRDRHDDQNLSTFWIVTQARRRAGVNLCFQLTVGWWERLSSRDLNRRLHLLSRLESRSHNNHLAPVL